MLERDEPAGEGPSFRHLAGSFGSPNGGRQIGMTEEEKWRFFRRNRGRSLARISKAM
jgi:hypothetical protein